MERINLIKTDNLVILVMDGQVYQKTIDENSIQLYDKLQFKVDKLNSGTVEDSDKYSNLKSELRMEMKPVRKSLEGESNIREETISLAKGDKSIEERKQIAKRIAAIDDIFEHDTDGLVYLKNHSVPMPMDLVTAILEAKYEKSQYTVSSLINFWYWAVLNPNQEARNDLFGWFKTGDFSITEDGLIVAYRCVNVKKEAKDPNSALKTFVDSEYVKIRAWKKSPKNYGVVEQEGKYFLLDFKSNTDPVSSCNVIGSLCDLYEDLNNTESVSNVIYTDAHTGRMSILMGEEVFMDRKDCDENRNASCSSGLHFMSKKYNLRLGEVKIIILINPMNVVAFPYRDNTKGRCCAYMPVALADTDKSGDITTLGNGTFDFDYANYTKDQLSDYIDALGIEQAIEDGLISSEITEEDFSLLRASVKKSMKSKVAYAD